MFRMLATTTTLSTALAVVLFALPVNAADKKVEDIVVTANTSAIQNPQAAEYFGNLGPDLESAIAALLVDKMTSGQSEKGLKVSVNVQEVELANSFETLTNLASTRLDANVGVFDDEIQTSLQDFAIEVSVEQMLRYMPEGTDPATLTLDTPVFYQALVKGFAAAVVERLDLTSPAG